MIYTFPEEEDSDRKMLVMCSDDKNVVLMSCLFKTEVVQSSVLKTYSNQCCPRMLYSHHGRSEQH